MIKAILFDFDGTLCDTAPIIVDTMRRTFTALKRPIPTESEMRATIGLPLVKALQQLGRLTNDEAPVAVKMYQGLFPKNGGTARFFPGVATTLAALHERGVRMAVCTSREVVSLLAMLRANGVARYFETQATNTDGLPPKPDPAPALFLLERMSLSPEQTLVVGDTTYDIAMGNAAGCPTCAVTYGNHSRERLATAAPTYTIDSFEQLLDVVAHTVDCR